MKKLLGKNFNGLVFTKYMFYVTTIATVYALLALISFADGEIHWELLSDRDYWLMYGLRLGLSIFMMFLAIGLKKEKEKMQPAIKKEHQIILATRNALTDAKRYDDFKDRYLHKYNNDEKTREYREWLLYKRETSRQKKSEEYNKLYLATYAPNFDIEKIHFEHKEVTTNTLFYGFASKGKGDNVMFSGYEDLFVWVAPTILVGAFVAALLLSTKLSKATQSVDKWKDMGLMVFTSISYMKKGIDYGDYSINEVYKSVLENRKSILRGYFNSIGMALVAEFNDTYMFVGQLEPLEEPKTEDIAQTPIEVQGETQREGAYGNI